MLFFFIYKFGSCLFALNICESAMDMLYLIYFRQAKPPFFFGSLLVILILSWAQTQD